MAIRCTGCNARHLSLPNATGATVATCPECEQMNDCQKAFELLHNMPDAQAIGGSDGPRIELRRKIAAPGTVSDGTRVFIVKPCERWRWLTVTLGWDTFGQIDQRDYFQQPDAMVQAVLNVIERRAAPYREELTAAGPQLVIPGCERVAPDNGKPAQLSLFA